ncbi:uncharacterized protein LOC112602180 [Melanaphis sacchari]|uniref:uncharacterized protein LOC112602180 n=1 Tax=Melanaphis sacchari TaxID=742174 RepID=UPI000DC13A9E|nr:uncharacterized protein LOC112602180 [Melanaphis sacchari]
MSKYKSLIIILMIMKFLYNNSEAMDFSNIFKLGDTNEMYQQRMISQGLPFVGESYDEYSKNIISRGAPQNMTLITKDEYKILMNSIPIINESMDSVNERNLETQKELQSNHPEFPEKYKLQQYTTDVFEELKFRYPRIYETYTNYKDRMDNLQVEPLGIEMFKNLKQYCPNFGELYDEYLETRSIRYGINGISISKFTEFQNSYPMLEENVTVFFKRINIHISK